MSTRITEWCDPRCRRRLRPAGRGSARGRNGVHGLDEADVPVPMMALRKRETPCSRCMFSMSAATNLTLAFWRPSRKWASSTTTIGPRSTGRWRHCKAYGATLVIAKIDRLSRDVPEANEMVVGLMALVAPAERRMISERTKAALQAATARGKRLGRPKGHIVPSDAATRARGSATNAANAQAFAERLRPVIT
jgi:hypothetical protein